MGMKNRIAKVYAIAALAMATALMSGCGGGGGGTSAANTPAPTATSGTTIALGGSIQGNPLGTLSTVSNWVGSTFGNKDGTGTAAALGQPGAITTDGVNIYVASVYYHKIWSINIFTAQATTLAGSGTPGSVNGFGTNASFNTIRGMVVVGKILYVTDAGNQLIREIDLTTKEVKTLAGTVGAPGSSDSPALFNIPYGITSDGTSLFVSEFQNNTIRKIGIASGSVSTLAGQAGVAGFTDGQGASATFSYPEGITTDGTNLYVVNMNYNAIRKIVITTGQVTTIAGGGVNHDQYGYTDGYGLGATFAHPYAITTDGSSLYICDYDNQLIRKVALSDAHVTTVAGIVGAHSATAGNPANGPAASSDFYNPLGITTDGQALFVTDFSNHKIRKIQ
jgi:hypothetical protein